MIKVLRRPVEYAQYTSIAFGSRCKEMGVSPSMGTVGDAYDYAVAESLFASLECELIARRSWKTKTEARLDVFTWIESWYNPRRRHSGLNYQSPKYIREEATGQNHQHRKPDNPRASMKKLKLSVETGQVQLHLDLRHKPVQVNIRTPTGSILDGIQHPDGFAEAAAHKLIALSTDER